MSGSEASFDVLSPRGRQNPSEPFEEVTHRPRPQGLSGKTVGFVWDYVFWGDVMFEEIQREIGQRYSDVSFVDYSVFGSITGPDSTQVVENLPELFRLNGVERVIVGVGA